MTDYSPLDLEDLDIFDGLDASDGSDGSTVGGVLNRLDAWLSRFIRTTSTEDIHLLTLWAAHTYVCMETYSSPRLQLDSVMPGSGKTTVLEHLHRFAFKPVQAASLSSPALLARMIDQGIRTILIDEVDRSLDPKKPGVEDLIAILNSGYKRGATRPVLVPSSGGQWDVKEMPTFSPVAMAGNAPHLPDDTRSRCIRVLLMPDLDGTVEASDWEDLEDAAAELKAALSAVMDGCRDLVKAARPNLPDGCTGRMREKWNPLARVAQVAGGTWPDIVAELIERDMKELEMERDDGLANLPSRVHLLHDLARIWHEEEPFIPTSQIIARLQTEEPDRWGLNAITGKKLTPQGMGRMLSQMKVYAAKDSTDTRGYFKNSLLPVWRRFNITPHIEPSRPSEQSRPSGGEN